MRRFLIATVCLFSLLSILAPPSLAQSDVTEINGTVRSASGALLARVTVTLTGPERDRTATTTTDAEGRYRFVNVSSGTYWITFSLEGFDTVDRPPFRMLSDFRARIDAELKPSPAR